MTNMVMMTIITKAMVFIRFLLMSLISPAK